MNKHTPGPWSWWTSCSFRRLSATNDGDVLHAVIQRGDGHPDIHFPNGGCDGPDARLIAAAPELLNACMLLLAVCAGQICNKQGLIDALTAGRNAIAKATGEDHD